MPVNIEVVGDAIAKAIKGGKQFRTEEHRAALKYIADNSDPDDMIDNVSRIANISAVRQELEKGGILPQKDSDSALIRAVRAAMT